MYFKLEMVSLTPESEIDLRAAAPGMPQSWHMHHLQPARQSAAAGYSRLLLIMALLCPHAHMHCKPACWLRQLRYGLSAASQQAPQCRRSFPPPLLSCSFCSQGHGCLPGQTRSKALLRHTQQQAGNVGPIDHCCLMAAAAPCWHETMRLMCPVSRLRSRHAQPAGQHDWQRQDCKCTRTDTKDTALLTHGISEGHSPEPCAGPGAAATHETRAMCFEKASVRARTAGFCAEPLTAAAQQLHRHQRPRLHPRPSCPAGPPHPGPQLSLWTAWPRPRQPLALHTEGLGFRFQGWRLNCLLAGQGQCQHEH